MANRETMKGSKGFKLAYVAMVFGFCFTTMARERVLSHYRKSLGDMGTTPLIMFCSLSYGRVQIYQTFAMLFVFLHVSHRGPSSYEGKVSSFEAYIAFRMRLALS